MGEVYEAVHALIGRRVAIKVLRHGVDEALNAARRLLEEARVVNAIRHPAIVDVFDVGVHADRRPYLVMELLEGRSVADRLKAEGPLPLGDALSLLAGVLEALGAAHRAGVIHRDLKPSNVFLVDESPGPARVKLLDFGIARRAGREELLTAPELAVGSIGFMAPEQLRGQAVAGSDLYAVGCLAFQVLTGRPVFPLKNIPEAARHHLSEPPPKVRTLRPQVTPLLDAWVDRLLQKEVAARYPTAEAALFALRAAQEALELAQVDPETEPASTEESPFASVLAAHRRRTDVVPAFQPPSDTIPPPTAPSRASAARLGPVPVAEADHRQRTTHMMTTDAATPEAEADTGSHTLLDS
jgi:serine/threonine-protein kinase